ncbi:Uncharacterised protein [Pseudomonas aeruginosa]|nr:Uncharacterised protein [Pseudomonas aeruginosa]
MTTLAAVAASFGTLASSGVAWGAGMAIRTWLNGPWFCPSESCRCQCCLPRKTSVMRQEKTTCRSVSRARVIALIRGMPTQRGCSSGEGLSWPSRYW